MALAYQVGKHQLMKLVGKAIENEGKTFDFQKIHDSVWNDGNVPFSLLNWELNGCRDDLDKIDADPLTGTTPPVPAYEL